METETQVLLDTEESIGHTTQLSPVNPDRDAHVLALAHIRGDETYDPEELFGELQRSYKTLSDPGSDAALQLLAEDIPILRALFLRYCRESVQERNTERAARKMRSAMMAHSEMCRTIALIQGLTREKQKQAVVTVGFDDD